MSLDHDSSSVFHIKVLELGEDAKLQIGWSCLAGDREWCNLMGENIDIKGKGKGWGKGKGSKDGYDSTKPLALVMDLDSKSGLSASYSASGALNYGNLDKNGSMFGAGDVVTCTITSTPDTLTASFALNGKMLPASRRWAD